MTGQVRPLVVPSVAGFAAAASAAFVALVLFAAALFATSLGGALSLLILAIVATHLAVGLAVHHASGRSRRFAARQLYGPLAEEHGRLLSFGYAERGAAERAVAYFRSRADRRHDADVAEEAARLGAALLATAPLGTAAMWWLAVTWFHYDWPVVALGAVGLGLPLPYALLRLRLRARAARAAAAARQVEARLREATRTPDAGSSTPGPTGQWNAPTSGDFQPKTL